MSHGPGASVLFSRALRRRCPNCGSSGLFDAWFRIRPVCPACGIPTERGEEGYVVGAYMFNIVGAELFWLALAGGVIWGTWPDPPWNLLLYGGGVLMIALPFLFYPFSKTIFLAFDLVFRPAGRE
jgi:uncharacterized protein (DUF983 family)